MPMRMPLRSPNRAVKTAKMAIFRLHAFYPSKKFGTKTKLRDDGATICMRKVAETVSSECPQGRQWDAPTLGRSLPS